MNRHADKITQAQRQMLYHHIDSVAERNIPESARRQMQHRPYEKERKSEYEYNWRQNDRDQIQKTRHTQDAPDVSARAQSDAALDGH